jgi:hypothetical protein
VLSKREYATLCLKKKKTGEKCCSHCSYLIFVLFVRLSLLFSLGVALLSTQSLVRYIMRLRGKVLVMSTYGGGG